MCQDTAKWITILKLSFGKDKNNDFYLVEYLVLEWYRNDDLHDTKRMKKKDKKFFCKLETYENNSSFTSL